MQCEKDAIVTMFWLFFRIVYWYGTYPRAYPPTRKQQHEAGGGGAVPSPRKREHPNKIALVLVSVMRRPSGKKTQSPTIHL